MDHGGRLKRVIQPFGPHARGRDPLELGIKELHELSGGLMVAVAKVSH
jgi:hypothetical protein